ncbi:hypothetical protein KBY83_12450 [Cyanobium sp. WKJ7-Wakatipu]|nr:hypothetical protein [Cyanobium sp. WKJ7-Wakatipu]
MLTTRLNCIERNPSRRAARRERLLHHSGGIYFGADLEQQLAIASPSAQRRSQTLTTLSFCCAPWAFAFIREGLQRYPIEHIRFSRPLAGDSWWHHPKVGPCQLPNLRSNHWVST